jgi:putative transposase
LIAAEKANYPVAVMSRVLGVNRTSFHDWERRPPSDRALSDAWLTEKIKQIHADSRGVYGSPRIHAELRLEHGIRVGRKRVARLMKAAGIAGVRPRKRWRTTIRVAGVEPATDLVQRDFSPQAPNVLWVADITYLRSGEGWLYLAAVQDAYSRAIVGWSMANHMRSTLVVDALEMALARRRPGPGLVHHSDQGSLRGLNRSSQQCVRELNLGTAGDGALGFAAGTRLAWRGCRREGSPGGRAGAAIGACAPFGGPSWARPASPCSAAVTQTLVSESRTSVAVGSGRRFQVLVEHFGGSSPVEGLPGARVQGGGDGCEVVGAVPGEVGSFREVLA